MGWREGDGVGDLGARLFDEARHSEGRSHYFQKMKRRKKGSIENSKSIESVRKYGGRDRISDYQHWAEASRLSLLH